MLFWINRQKRIWQADSHLADGLVCRVLEGARTTFFNSLTVNTSADS